MTGALRFAFVMRGYATMPCPRMSITVLRVVSIAGHKACRDNRSVLYTRLPRLIDDLSLVKGDGRIAARMKSLARVDLLILDDWGLEPLDGNARHHLLEILEDRYGHRSTLVTSQLPVARWFDLIGDPTYADAILDRLVHNAHRLELSGESMRRSSISAAADRTANAVTSSPTIRCSACARSDRNAARHQIGIWRVM